MANDGGMMDDEEEGLDAGFSGEEIYFSGR